MFPHFLWDWQLMTGYLSGPFKLFYWIQNKHLIISSLVSVGPNVGELDVAARMQLCLYTSSQICTQAQDTGCLVDGLKTDTL